MGYKNFEKTMNKSKKLNTEGTYGSQSKKTYVKAKRQEKQRHKGNMFDEWSKVK